MADEDATESKGNKARSPLMVSILVSSVIGFISGGLGFALFTFILPSSSSSQEVEADPVDLTPAFVEFGEVVVNLAEGRMTRFLRMDITLQVTTGDLESVTANVELKQAILRDGVISYGSGLQLEDIQGPDGQNRIRRELQNQFNEVLAAEDRIDVVQNVLFKEFTVQ